MKYCPNCGTGHDCTEADAESRESAEVAIARIQAERDIKVAQITAREDKDWNETRVEVAGIEAEAEVAAAVAEAEVIGAAIEAGVVADETVEPVVIDVDATADGGDADASEELPPAEGSPAPEPSGRKSIGLGMW